jgi:16S rRNA (guanine966-N2)-methyltransferase
VRIVAGRLGGRRLVAPKGAATRPTGDRVKEALFSVLGSLEGARVVDLYAGTGALGLEALSRGASHVVLVESASPALAALRENVRVLGCETSCTLVAARVERIVDRLAKQGPFDLVLADPPWAEVAEATRAIAALVAAGGVAREGTVVLEHAAEDAPSIAGLAVRERRRYGDTGLSLFDPASGEARTDAVPSGA